MLLNKIFTFSLIISVSFILIACQNSNESESTNNPNATITPKEDKSLEYKLATINANGYVKKDDITVTRFRYLLNNISQHTGYPPEKIGDITVFAQKELHEKNGKEINLLSLMEEANKVLVKNKASKIKYEEIISMLMVMLSD